MPLLHELKRRHVLRTAGLYIVTSWLVLQAAEVLVGLEALPSSIGRPLLWVLLIGFPIVIGLSWLFEWTSKGLQLDTIEGDGNPVSSRGFGRRLDAVIIAMLVAMVVFLVYDRSPSTGSFEGQKIRPSIVVLPFANLSRDSSQEYFSDGISEQLIGLLTRVQGLAVTSRASAFSFKGTRIPVAEIANQLNVAYVLDGSVRREGDNVRIRVELIDAASDTHIWSESFDHVFENIFAIQDRIAAVVVDKLRVTLRGALPQTQVTDVQAHRLFLQGQYANNLGSNDSIKKSGELCQGAVAIDPDYAPAWECLATAYSNQANRNLLPGGQGYELAEGAARKAIELDADSYNAYRTLAYIANYHHGDLHAAAQYLERALTLAPSGTGQLSGASLLLASLGRFEQAVLLAERAIQHDPLGSVTRGNLAANYFWAGRWQESIDAFRTLETLSPDYFALHYRMGESLIMAGQLSDARVAMNQEQHPIYRLVGLCLVEHALGNDVAAKKALTKLVEDHADIGAYNIAYVYAGRGDSDRAFEFLEHEFKLSGKGVFSEILGDHGFASIHDDPRWLEFLFKVGRAPEQVAAIQFKVPAFQN